MSNAPEPSPAVGPAVVTPRIQAKAQESVLLFGAFSYRPKTRELYKGSFRVRVSASQLRLLSLFLEQPGHLVSREEIARRLWTETSTIDVERGINTAINSLRSTLGDNPSQPWFLETVVGLGYRLIVPVQEREADGPATWLEDATALPEPVRVPDSDIALLSAPQGEIPTLSASEGTTAQAADMPHRLRSASARNLLWAASVAVLLLPAGWLVWTHSWTKRPAFISPTAKTGETQFEPATFDYGNNKVTAAAISPDGTTVAYADDAGISLHHFDGSADTAMNSERGLVIDHMAWLPNAPTLLASNVDVFSGRRQASLINAEGYFQINLPDVSRAEPSPDGKSIAFTSREGRELWTATVDGDGPQRLPAVSDGETIKFLLWSNDGHYLLISGYKAGIEKGYDTAPPEERWFYRTVDIGSGRVLTNTPGVAIDSGFLTPDNTLRFINQSTSVGIVDKTHTAEMKVATQPRTGALIGTPTVAEEIPGHPAPSISVSRSASREAVLLNTSALDVFIAQLSEDGASLKNKTPLTHGVFDAYPHAWTADGGILFERVLNGKTAIFLQSQGQNEPRLVAKMAADLFGPQLSPDGRWVLFMARDGQVDTIYRVPIAGGHPEPVPNTNGIEDFHCPIQATARCIVSKPLGREAIAYYSLDSVKGIGKEVVRTSWKPAHLGSWNVSPDGAMIDVVADSGTNPGLDLITLSANPPAHRFLSLPGHGAVLEATWSANGKSLYVECRSQLGFSLIYKELDTEPHTQERVVATSPNLLYAVPSPDGKKLAFPILRLTTDVWSRPFR